MKSKRHTHKRTHAIEHRQTDRDRAQSTQRTGPWIFGIYGMCVMHVCVTEMYDKIGVAWNKFEWSATIIFFLFLLVPVARPRTRRFCLMHSAPPLCFALDLFILLTLCVFIAMIPMQISCGGRIRGAQIIDEWECEHWIRMVYSVHCTLYNSVQ